MSRKPPGPSGDLACLGADVWDVKYQVDNYHVARHRRMSSWPGVSLLRRASSSILETPHDIHEDYRVQTDKEGR